MLRYASGSHHGSVGDLEEDVQTVSMRETPMMERIAAFLVRRWSAGDGGEVRKVGRFAVTVDGFEKRDDIH